MSQTDGIDVVNKRGRSDAGKYFKYMSEFVGLTQTDINLIRQTKPVIEKNLPLIVAEFYSHLLRYPPTRKFFLKKDGSLDQEYLEMRMRHLSNFWVRTAGAELDDDYARYIDYVGQAHTSHGADPHIYIAERYVIGQVGFMQRLISQVIRGEIEQTPELISPQAIEAWEKLMMVILEMLARSYSDEREEELYDPLIPINQVMVQSMAQHAYEHEFCSEDDLPVMDVKVAQTAEIPDGERKIVKIGNVSVGIFHLGERWVAIRNSCIHRGGPIALGTLTGDTITCPWHGYEYNIYSGQLLADASAKLSTYPVAIVNDEVHIIFPDYREEPVHLDLPDKFMPTHNTKKLNSNEILRSAVQPGKIASVEVDGEVVIVVTLDGQYYALEGTCTHRGGILADGDIVEGCVECPVHGAQYNLRTGEVELGPATVGLKTYQVSIDGDILRVE